MDTNENTNFIQHEKNKLHLKYIIAFSIIISLGSVALSLYNQYAFVAQVAFASTITSIVLSVIAIWMSISAERLSQTTQKVEPLNENNEKTHSFYRSRRRTSFYNAGKSQRRIRRLRI